MPRRSRKAAPMPMPDLLRRGFALSAHADATLPIAIEETLRFFADDGIRKALTSATIVNAAPVVRGCRMIKTAPELALMRKATDVTIAAYRHTSPRIREGMTPAE